MSNMMQHGAGLVLMVILVMFAGCEGGSTSSSAPPAELTPEQEQIARDSERGLETLRQDSELLLAEMEQSSEPDFDTMRADLEAALAEAQRAVGGLRRDDGRTWEEKLADVDQAIRELGRQFAQASIRVKSGDMTLPGVGD